ncbi:substrate-binding domain-containing protein [Allohahella marinimesophila]|uniref:SsuA/THI5-like domain-containing protein n=1 Tax=Allohahella marinimesophila TaxID=1054972 RepID=A0ABP7NRW1_9GAMM
MQNVEELLKSRRNFLKGASMTGVAALLPMGFAAALNPTASWAASSTMIKTTHGTGFCNLGLFLVKERNLAKDDGVELDFVVTPSNADIATLFGAGIVEMSMIPYSNFITLYDAGAPVKIVAGGGVEGCMIVAAEGIKSAADLRGKTLGTFQADTLEVLPFDYLKKAGMSFKDVDVRYFNTSPEMAQAFISGAIDSMCHIEPYASQSLASRKGATIISDGTDLYGSEYSDCVLAVRTPLLEKNPGAVKAVIKALLVAQSQVEADPEAALKATVGRYYKTSMEAARDAKNKQPVKIDQRDQTSFILARGESLKELGYVKKIPDDKAIDWTLLEQVIAENQPLYDSLKLTSAGIA